MIELDRRRAIISAAGLAVGGMTTARLLPEEMLLRDRRPASSRVAILSAVEYSEAWSIPSAGSSAVQVEPPRKVRLAQTESRGVHRRRRGEYETCAGRRSGRGISQAGRQERCGWRGPWAPARHILVLAESGLADQLHSQKISFVDLNRDELVKVPTRATYTGLEHLWLPRTVLETDFVVSMPKIKTHHWAGVTLSMKNMFGVVPGTKYGWPKNVLHWKGIHRSILDICATAPMHFVIADGVVAMEGNGPLHGTHRNLGKIVLADDPVAADFICARLMGLDPSRVWHLDRAAHFLGNGSYERIELIAEGLPQRTVPFDVLPEFAHLQIRA